MLAIKFTRAFVVLSLLTMFGCRTYHWYEYKSVKENVFEGTLSISLNGRPGEGYVKDGKKQADYSFPYSLQFIYSMPYEYDVSGMSIRDVELIGEESGNRFTLPNAESYRVNNPRRTNPDAKDRTIIKSIGGITADKYKYEDYNLLATIVIFDGEGNAREKEISVILKTNFRKSKRSDWLDEELGV